MGLKRDIMGVLENLESCCNTSQVEAEVEIDLMSLRKHSTLTELLGRLNGLLGATDGHDLSQGYQVVVGFEKRVAAAQEREQDHPR